MARKNRREGKGNRRERARSDVRRRKERTSKRELAGKSFTDSPSAPKFTREHLEAVEVLLSGIGTPEPKPFVPDEFQLEALSAIEIEDVLVTAPTGSGKTWIAREEIRRLLEQGKRAWYTTPLKALTNSKY
ncbi:MAG TPA: DEAD/DEAH box helicase, partial [Pyrinomonadaceae bacterium]|nr:DEAD/DEAH box helicase [Pyrinomonadaceae bacterium]